MSSGSVELAGGETRPGLCSGRAKARWEGRGHQWEESIPVPESEEPPRERVGETLDSGRKGAGWNGAFWSLWE